MSPEEIVAALRDRVDAFARLRCPALLERFVADRGRAGIAKARPRGIRRKMPKMCFENAARLLLERGERGWKYVEGYGFTPALRGFPIHHAWVENERGEVIDVTWATPAECVYFGVPFTVNEFRRHTALLGSWGLFETHRGLNVDLIFALAPELREWTRSVQNSSRADQGFTPTPV